MYVRQVSALYNPAKFGKFNQRFEGDVIPLLKKQSGFRDELSFYDKDKDEAISLSFWDTKEDAEIYARDVYPKVHEKMADMLASKPKIRSFDLANSTWYGSGAN